MLWWVANVICAGYENDASLSSAQNGKRGNRMDEENGTNQVVLLLGAGASAEAGVPTGDEITDTFVNYSRYCDSQDSFHVENTLRYMQVRIAEHMGGRAPDVNFEHLLGVLVELEMRGQYPVAPLLGEGDALVRRLEQQMPIRQLVDDLCALLREVLHVDGPCEHLRPISELVKQHRPLDIFTLNYDVSVEAACRAGGMAYTTGHREREGGYAVWDPREFQGEDLDVRVFKLHGSVDWAVRYLVPPPTSDRPDIPGWTMAHKFIGSYPESVKVPSAELPSVVPPGRTGGLVSLMNFGTRKELLYARKQYAILFDFFMRALEKASVCIVGGYSFRDERINDLLEEAVILRDGELGLVVVNPSYHRIAVRHPMLDAFRQRGWLTPVLAPFAEALQSHELSRAVAEHTSPTTGERSRPPPLLSVPALDAEPEEATLDQLLGRWRVVGQTFMLAAYRVLRARPELEALIERRNLDDLRKLSHILRHVLRKTKDLCCHVHAAATAIVGSPHIDGAHLAAIQTSPKSLPQSVASEKVYEWLWEFEAHFSRALASFESALQQLEELVAECQDGRRPATAFDLTVNEKHAVRTAEYNTYEFACFLNRIFKDAGYEGPFEEIAEEIKRLESRR